MKEREGIESAREIRRYKKRDRERENCEKWVRKRKFTSNEHG